MPVTIRVEEAGTAEVRARFLDLCGSMRSAIRRELLAIGKDVESKARGLAPVLQSYRKGRVAGALRNSIKARLQETDAQVGVTVRPGKFYGQILESGVVRYRGATNARPTQKAARGTVRFALQSSGQWRVRPRPFMRPAREAVEPTARARIEAAAAAVIAAGG